MTNLMSKTSLYDMLSSVIPGYLLLKGCIVLFHPRLNCILDNCLFGTVAIFSLGYICGLMLKFLSNCIFGKALNSICLIRCVYVRMQKEGGEKYSVSLPENDMAIRSFYNVKYYYVLLNYMSSAISVLESQVAFLRSMAMVLFFYIVFPERIIVGLLNLDESCDLRFFLLVFLVIVVIMMFYIQTIIIRRVFEDEHYVKSLLTDNKTSLNATVVE